MSTHEELRTELLSVIAAAPELEPDSRAHLADVFLDRLESDYLLVPRNQTDQYAGRQPRSWSPGPLAFLWPAIPLILVAVVLFSLVSTSMFVLFHPPILLFALLIFLVVRSRFWGPRRRIRL